MLALSMTSVHAQVTEYQRWDYSYGDGPGAQTGAGTSVAVDNSGNVYTTGSTNTTTSGATEIYTAKFDTWGVIQWGVLYAGPLEADGISVAVDASGFVYVAGTIKDLAGGNHIVTLKYNQNGGLIWARIYQDLPCQAAKIRVDSQGESIIAGLLLSPNSMFVIKYDASGNLMWTKTHAGTATGCMVRDEVLDSQGNIYITGYISNVNTNWDICTIKYSPSGTEDFALVYNGPNSLEDEAWSVALDSHGNIYTGGYIGVSSSPPDLDLALIKYNSSGVQQWIRTYNSGANSTDYATAVGVNSNGDIYVAGSSGSKYLAMKYDSSGNQIWTNVFSNYSLGRANAIWVNPPSGVYVTGTVASGGNALMTTVRYNPSNGNAMWTAQYQDQDNTFGPTISFYPGLLRSDVYVTNGMVNHDYIAVGYRELYYAVRYIFHNFPHKSLINLNYIFDTIHVNIQNPNSYIIQNVDVTIDSLMHNNDQDLRIELLHGTVDTLVSYSGGMGSNFINTVFDDSTGIPINQGSAPFSGYFIPFKPLSRFDNANTNGDWILRVYDNSSPANGSLNAWTLALDVLEVTLVKNGENKIPDEYALSQNYPNPFNPSTKIQYQIPKGGNVRLVIYDLLGRVVRTLVNEYKRAGKYSVEFNAEELASGVYFCRISAGSFTDSKKMLLVK